jgi:hypothetical protein
VKVPTLDEVRTFARYHLWRRAFDHPARDPSLDVVELPYAPDELKATLSDAAHGIGVEVVERLRFRDRLHEVLSVALGPRSARARVLVLAGVHGNEHAGVLACPEIVRRLREGPAASRDVHVRLVLPVNPVGAIERSRFNAEGYDINRDFVHFSTPEARLVRRLVEEVQPTFVVSLHEGPQDATFFFANPEVGEDRSSRLARRLAAAGTTLATRDYFGRTLSPAGVAGPSLATRALTRAWEHLLGMQATNGYASRLGIPEITLESSWRSPDHAARLSAHVAMVLAVVDEVSEPRPS